MECSRPVDIYVYWEIRVSCLILILCRIWKQNVILDLFTVLNTLGQWLNLIKPTGHVMHQQFNIPQLYVLPTLYLCGLYLSENKQRLVPLTA